MGISDTFPFDPGRAIMEPRRVAQVERSENPGNDGIPQAVSDDTSQCLAAFRRNARAGTLDGRARFCETRLNSGLLAALGINGRRAKYS